MDDLLSLTQSLQGRSITRRWQAAEALGRLRDSRAVPALCAALEDGEPNVRGRAAGALGQIGDAAALSALSRAQKDPYAYVRSAAAIALGRIGTPAAAAALCRALGDPEREVRRTAAVALGTMAGRRPVPGLHAALPLLRRMRGTWSPENGWDKKVYRETIRTLEAVEPGVSYLPLPSRTAPCRSDELPLPAQVPEPLPRQLPVPWSRAEELGQPSDG